MPNWSSVMSDLDDDMEAGENGRSRIFDVLVRRRGAKSERVGELFEHFSGCRDDKGGG